MIDGIDVSAAQGTHIDWDRVARAQSNPRDPASRFLFAGMKAFEGTAYRDPTYARDFAEASRVGLYTIAYVYAHPRLSPEAHAEGTWEALGGTLSHGVMLDLETSEGITGAQLVAWVRRFVARWATFSAVLPILYTGYSFIEQFAGDRVLRGARDLAVLPLWTAAYPPKKGGFYPGPDYLPKVPPPWAPDRIRPDFTQYSGDVGLPVDGVAKACDRDVFFGDEEDLRTRIFGLPPREPTPIAA